MKILSDNDLERVLPMDRAIEAIERYFEAAASGDVVSPPRSSVTAGKGGLTFTIGAEMRFTKAIGYRVYPTYPTGRGTRTDQIVAVYSTESGALLGMVVGPSLGAIRTAAIGGAALTRFCRERPEQALVIGAGFQARFQVEALMAVRRPRRLLITSRTQSRAESLRTHVVRRWPGVNALVVSDLETAVRGSEVVVCATSSPTPVIEADWVTAGTYVATIGPKSREAHELPAALCDRAGVLVSDAVQQIRSFGDRYFISDTARIEALEHSTTRPDSPSAQSIRVFLSTGRSGTEVVVAHAALTKEDGSDP